MGSVELWGYVLELVYDGEVTGVANSVELWECMIELFVHRQPPIPFGAYLLKE